ncbi:unnamed protein product [Vicia faba]|uniref:Transmembrane protein n=1 Tax=Vicia faba TaxID=3906 RepID=A0AAV0ZLU1_VICFA|nr:unnamed protein product [Vicia faba]
MHLYSSLNSIQNFQQNSSFNFNSSYIHSNAIPLQNIPINHPSNKEQNNIILHHHYPSIIQVSTHTSFIQDSWFILYCKIKENTWNVKITIGKEKCALNLSLLLELKELQSLILNPNAILDQFSRCIFTHLVSSCAFMFMPRNTFKRTCHLFPKFALFIQLNPYIK